MNKIFKWILIPVILISFGATAQVTENQSKKATPENWFLLDKKASGYYGISLDKAYEALKGKKSQTVVVGVIDSGIDTTHAHLKPVLWRNSKEIPNNKIDDDKDGYTDNYYGWNFLGNADGANVKKDSYEAARVYWNFKERFDKDNVDTTSMSELEKFEYHTWLRAKDEVTGGTNLVETAIVKRMLPVLLLGDSVIQADLEKKEYNGEDLKGYQPTTREAQAMLSILRNVHQMNNTDQISNRDLLDQMEGDIRKAEAANTPPEHFRAEVVGDKYNDIDDKYYGNSDVMTGTPLHGTHVSGIIGATPNKEKNVSGVANNVRILTVRAVPDGDEHDKDVALAIRYAVDNGAKIINMSFGKSYSPQKYWVDDAVKYAAEHDVLLIHAAGNSSKNLDSTYNYPNADFLFGKGRAKNYITVGASGDPTNGGITARFSNYGKKEVDVFAPGVGIYSTVPNDDAYGKLNGTSMAAPVVSGIAALLLSYFPDLSAEQLKWVIEKSVVPVKEKVILPGTQDAEELQVNLSDISKTGGIVNAYEAVKLAMTLKGERKKK